MRWLQREDHVILVTEGDEERSAMQRWKASHRGSRLLVLGDEGDHLALRLVRASADPRPLNVTSRHPDQAVNLISNFAETPFEMDGQAFRSVESFWQGLKHPPGPKRDEMAALSGPEAKRACNDLPYPEAIDYLGERMVPGTFAHWRLMERACRAKFSQHQEARQALLATGTRPLIHRIGPPSRAIRGDVMAAIWISIRAAMADGAPFGGCDDG